jgi:hypothetical protein
MTGGMVPGFVIARSFFGCGACLLRLGNQPRNYAMTELPGEQSSVSSTSHRFRPTAERTRGFDELHAGVAAIR